MGDPVIVLQMQAWLLNNLVIFSSEILVQMNLKFETQKLKIQELEIQKLSYYLIFFKFPPQTII